MEPLFYPWLADCIANERERESDLFDLNKMSWWLGINDMNMGDFK